MPGQFLRAAFHVLDVEVRPLTAEQIVGIARERHLLKTFGKTPTNTMRARLSDDIRTNGARSPFQRIGPNRFGLREWDFSEYHARPFQKGLPDEITVCVPGTIQETLGFGGVGYSPMQAGILDYFGHPTNLTYLARQTAETTSKYKQLIAYVWLETTDGLVLSYTRGKYSSAHRTLLLGRRSVGFGGHVLQQDAESLFGVPDAGLEQAAMREIGEELKLKGQLPRNIRPVGVIWDDSSFEGQKHIGVVMRGVLPHSDEMPKLASELSINQLQLLTRKQLWDAYHAMEFWSQLLIREFASESKPAVVSTVVPSRRPRRIRHIAFVGEIANGKSSLAEATAQTTGYGVVSASGVLRNLLGVGEISEQNRLTFQSLALDFIKAEAGPAQLAQAIVKVIDNSRNERVIIDGIRQLTTLTALRESLSDLIVIYIDCPRDLAYQNYRSRYPAASVLQFAAVREHPVESDLPLFRFEADAIVSNADDSAKTRDVLLQWLAAE